MTSKAEKQMAKMVDAVQPRCDEKIIAAMTCSHAGSMSAVLLSKLMDGAGAGIRSSSLPNPVFIAVGESTVYAFHYKPWFFSFKIKKEAARWPRKALRVAVEESRAMVSFVMTTDTGESHPLEMPIVFGGKDVVQMFLEALGGQ
jgi:hypothetical protein